MTGKIVILEKEANMFRRRKEEAIYKRACDDVNLMNPDKGTRINACWNKFNDVARRRMRRIEL